MPDFRAALLGVDFGQRTTGFAIGHRMTGTARPLSPVNHKNVDTLLKQVEKLLAEWAPAAVVVGLPLAMDGSETDMSRRARDFATRLKRRFPDVDVFLHDERLTSDAAAQRHAQRRQQGRSSRRDDQRLDSLAAGLILESWMASHPADAQISAGEKH